MSLLAFGYSCISTVCYVYRKYYRQKTTISSTDTVGNELSNGSHMLDTLHTQNTLSYILNIMLYMPITLDAQCTLYLYCAFIHA